ncbi:MAG: MBL fold metallo-hydrolase, partial [Thermoanaerobacterium sp.]|nr:MBL fold metallo-hydrolase [Thermoanaerobacterium sp.]
MKQIYDRIISEYDTKLRTYVEERRYMDAYKYIFKQKNLVSDLDRNIYFYLILWQVKVEIYLGIIDDAKEHFLNIFDNIILSKNNISLFIECVLLLDMFELSLKKDGIYEQLMNCDEENNWINLYIFMLSFKNKSRNYSIEDELVYMVEKNTDRFFQSLIHTILAEVYKDEGSERWHIELKKAYELNHNNLRMIRLMIQWGIKGDD